VDLSDDGSVTINAKVICSPSGTGSPPALLDSRIL
jgi:hypothetical protein